MFTVGSASSLWTSISFWESVDYLSALAVLLGVIGEFIAEFVRLPRAESRRRHLEKMSMLILIAGLSIELVALMRTNTLADFRIAELDLERVQLEAQIAPRRLTMAQRKAIAEAVRPFAGRSVSVASFAIDLDGAQLAKVIQSALADGGLRVQDDSTLCVPLMGGLAAGVFVNGTERDLVGALRGALLAQLGPNDVATADTTVPCQRFGHSALGVDVIVGLKPAR